MKLIATHGTSRRTHLYIEEEEEDNLVDDESSAVISRVMSRHLVFTILCSN
jgi:hypothetical protein